MPLEPAILDALESFYGPQQPTWPTDPFDFLIWWHCGYPPSGKNCAKGWAALQAGQDLEAALKKGGIIAKERADCIQFIRANRPEIYTRAALKKLPGIGNPGADRILLFANIEDAAAIPSNSPHVAVRIVAGKEDARYTANYKTAQQQIAHLPAETKRRAYLLLKIHGEKLCTQKNPKCASCPIQQACRFYATINA